MAGTTQSLTGRLAGSQGQEKQMTNHPNRSTATRMTAVPTDLQYRVTAPMTPEKGDAVAARISAYARSVVRLFNDDGTEQFRAHESEAHHVRAAIRAAQS